MGTNDQRVGRAPPAAREAPPGDPRPRRILVVDDERDAAEALSMLLAIWGHDVRVAHAGQEAVRIGTVFCPEVVVLDLGLPDTSGYDVARRLRSSVDTASVRVIVVSGDSRAIDARSATELGIDHHLVKPVDLRLLKALISDVDPAPSG